MPLLRVYVLQQVRDHHLLEKTRVLLLAFLFGLGMTAYGTFVLFLPAVVIGLIWTRVRDKARVDLTLVARLAGVIALTVVPYLSWIYYVRSVNGTFYSLEIATQNQFVWILPLLRSNPLAALWRLAANFLTLTKYAAVQAGVLPLVLAGVILLTLVRERKLPDRLALFKGFPLDTLVISGLYLLFFAINGEVARRTAFPAVPPLIVGTAVVANALLMDATPTRRRLGVGWIALVVVAQALITVYTFGPFN